MNEKSPVTVTAGRISVRVTNPGKVLFPGDGITKADLAGYYREAAGRILPQVKGRPLVMERYPDGIGGERIVQKNVPAYFPDWVSRTEVAKEGGTVCHVLADKPATLVYLANQGCIEPHVFLSRTRALHCPDQLVFDLDPAADSGFGDARRIALWLRELLEDELGLAAFVKTTGGKGLHVHVPLRADSDFGQAREFARTAAAVLAARHPDLITTEQRRDKRGRRVYADIMRNAYAQTVIAPYAVRARPGAPIATPLSWDEVADPALSPQRFTLRGASARPDAAGDPWAAMARRRRDLGRAWQRLRPLGG
ncbi:MAG: non-homologous end-joining DNA ligase [Actinobacteria bacterium]|nr:non-homologous end-joining DNA ligase [Actinomycetota bacterium]